MKANRFIISLLITLSSFTSFAQERNANPGEDPNEAMTSDGAGVPNYGCPDANKSCFKNMKHSRLGDNTRALPASANDSKKVESGGSNTGAGGTR